MPALNDVQNAAYWAANDSAVNDVATATKAAESGKQHCISNVTASFSAAAIALLEIKEDSTTVFSTYVHNGQVVTFPTLFQFRVGAAVSATLAAGGSGVTGAVSMAGLTV